MKRMVFVVVAGLAAFSSTAARVTADEIRAEYTIWDGIEDDWCQDPANGSWPRLKSFETLVLMGDWGNRLFATGNGLPQYTVFAPALELYGGVDHLLEGIGTSLREIAGSPAIVAAILADHIANGSFSQSELANPNLTSITMLSGYVATWDAVDFKIAGQPVVDGAGFGNGWLYCIYGFIDSTPQIPTESLNALDTPKNGTPGGSNSLPNTH